jgi:hypothetical protein
LSISFLLNQPILRGLSPLEVRVMSIQCDP